MSTASGHEGCPLARVRETAANVGTALQTRCAASRAAKRSTYYGVFGDAHWNGNKERIPDELLKNLIEHFSRSASGNTRVPAM